MAVVAIESFDLYNGTGSSGGLTSPQAWTAVNWFYGPGLGTGRFGGQCFYWANETCETGWNIPATGPKFTVACAYRNGNLTSLNAAGNPRAALSLSSGGFGNRMLGWRPNPDGSIAVYRMTATQAGTLLGTSAPGVLLTNVWHFIEMSGTFNTATGAVTIKVDGVAVITLTNVNTCGQAASTSFDGIVWGSNGLSGGVANYIDDIYILDTDISLGERRIEVIRPSADTTTIQWTPNSGTTHYTRVNDTLVNTGTWNSSTTVGQIDLYETVDLSSVPNYVDYVQITAWMQKGDAGTRAVDLVADIAGTQLLSADKALTASLIKYAFGMAAKPGGGSWTGADVNNLRVGVKVSV